MNQMQLISAKIQHIMQHQALKHVLTHSKRQVVTAFLESASKQSYAPQSGEIFGILGQMKETFETNLADAQKDEASSVKAYEELKAAKEEEISEGQSMLDEKTQQLANTDEKNAEAKEDLVDTKASLAADEEFLANLKEQCSSMDAEWEERQKTRALETEACSKALALLTSDDAHDLFSKTFSLVQTQSATESKRRAEVSALLAAAAKKTHSPR